MNKLLRARRALALVVFLGVLVWAADDASHGDWFVFGHGSFGLLLGAIIVAVIFPIKVKRVLIVALSSPGHRAAHAEEFPQLNRDELDRLTRAWEELGFVQRGDFASQPVAGLDTSFSRLLEHPEEGTIAEVFQQAATTKATLLTSMLESFWGNRESVQQQAQMLERTAATMAPLSAPTSTSTPDEVLPLEMWVSITHNRAANRYFSLLRHPRVVGVRLEKDASPAQLWAVHKKRSALVEARLGSHALRGDLLELMEEHRRVLNAVLLRRLKAMPTWKLLRYRFVSASSSPAHFDGELAPLDCSA